jgi:hypothetical protein
MPKPHLSHRIYADPAYAELARTVGYAGIEFPLAAALTERLNAKHGAEKVSRALDELIDFDHAAKVAKLKPYVRRLCFGLLGPAPEDEDWYYRNPDGSPMDQPAEAASRSSRRTLSKRKPRSTSGRTPRSRQPHERGSQTSPVTSTDRQPITELSGAELMQRYFAAKRTLASETAGTGVAWEARIEFDRLHGECRRRGFNLPPDGPGPDPLPEVERFRQHTTRRLRELLDMAQYDIAKNSPDTIPHQEAVRDIGFIHAELQRREAALAAAD